jgi:hypothetical protein
VRVSPSCIKQSLKVMSPMPQDTHHSLLFEIHIVYSTQFVCSSALWYYAIAIPLLCYTHSQRKRKCPSVARFYNFVQNRRRRQKHANSMYVCACDALGLCCARRQRLRWTCLARFPSARPHSSAFVLIISMGLQQVEKTQGGG